tara:strand:- start:972 stop:1154 length:183 start_codon:yes stop_codon:yes gene_type:complete
MNKPHSFDLMISYIDEEGNRQYDVIIMDMDRKLSMSGKKIKNIVIDHIKDMLGLGLKRAK